MNISYSYVPINEQEGIYKVKVGQKDIMTGEEGKIVYVAKVLVTGTEIEDVLLIGGYIHEEYWHGVKCGLLDCIEKATNNAFAHDILIRLPARVTPILNQKNNRKEH